MLFNALININKQWAFVIVFFIFRLFNKKTATDC